MLIMLYHMIMSEIGGDFVQEDTCIIEDTCVIEYL